MVFYLSWNFQVNQKKIFGMSLSNDLLKNRVGTDIVDSSSHFLMIDDPAQVPSNSYLVTCTS
jgi:hypothetical protein